MTRRNLLLLALLFFLTSCAVNPVTKKRELMLVSLSKEKRLGKEAALVLSKESLSEGPFLKEGWAVSYLQSLVNKLMPYYERRDEMPVSLRISTSPIPNAWSVPGFITVDVGIIPCLGNEAQLAFILGHELGHIAARHTAERYTKSVLLSLGTQALDIFAGSLASTVGSIAGSFYIASYSRSQELLADRLGQRYMALAGYDPYQSIEAMRNIEKCAKRLGLKKRSGFLERLLADHPGTQKRIKELEFQAANYQRTFYTGSEANFQRLKRWAAPRVELLRKLEKSVSLASKGEYEKADCLIQKALKEMPSDFEAPFKAKAYALAAFSYFKLEDYPMAWKYSLKATQLQPDYYIAYKIAGISGIREETDQGYRVAEKAFEECLYRKYRDRDYNEILHIRPVDTLCLKGSIIASCRLGHREKCSKFCRVYYKRFGGFSRTIMRYCLR